MITLWSIEQSMALDVKFYEKENGDVPVMSYLLSLDAKMRAKVFSEIELFEKHGFELKEPYVKAIKGKRYKGIYEQRIRLASNLSRIFYFVYEQNTFVLLHGFTKKTDTTPERELLHALRYRDDYERRSENE